MAKRHIRVRLPEDILAGMDRALAERPIWYTRLPPDEDEAEFGRISDRAQGFLDEW